MKEAGYGKEDICTDLFVDIAALALFSDRDYCDLLIFRGVSVGYLDGIFYQTLFFVIHYRCSSFFDECID